MSWKCHASTVLHETVVKGNLLQYVHLLCWALIGPMTNVQDDLRHLTVNFVRSTEAMKDTQDLLMQQVERF